MFPSSSKKLNYAALPRNIVDTHSKMIRDAVYHSKNNSDMIQKVTEQNGTSPDHVFLFDYPASLGSKIVFHTLFENGKDILIPESFKFLYLKEAGAKKIKQIVLIVNHPSTGMPVTLNLQNVAELSEEHHRPLFMDVVYPYKYKATNLHTGKLINPAYTKARKKDPNVSYNDIIIQELLPDILPSQSTAVIYSEDMADYINKQESLDTSSAQSSTTLSEKNAPLIKQIANINQEGDLSITPVSSPTSDVTITATSPS